MDNEKVQNPQCDVCGVRLRESQQHTDDDGFTACRPSFPVSNRAEDADRFLDGPCPGKHRLAAHNPTREDSHAG